jgi:ABC-type transport system involved in multi-copper enzyme maturation permease subunit
MVRSAASLLRFLVSPDPMMRKEMLGASRRWQTYFFRAMYVGVLGFVVWAVWLGQNRYGSVTYSDLARIGRDLFEAFAWGQLVMVALGGVVLASDMVSKEVRDRTLGIALLTPLGAPRIVLGKWKSCMGYLLLFILSGLPILSVSVYLGGVDWALFGNILAVTLAAAVLCVSLSLWVSTWIRTSYAGFVISALLLFAYTIGPLLLLLAAVGPYRMGDFTWAMVYNPAFVIGDLLYGGRAGQFPEGAWAICAASCALLSLACVVLSIRRTARLGLQEPGPALLRRIFQGMDKWFLRINPWGITFGGRRTEPYESNPLLWKEIHFRATGRLRYFTRISLALMLVAALILRASGNSVIDPGFYVPAAVIAGILLLLTAIGAGSGAFTKEREEGKWDILLTTPLSAPQFVFGKLLGAFATTAPALLMFLLSVVPAFAAASGAGGGVGHLFAFLFVTGLFYVFVVLASTWFSLWASTTRKAFGLSLFLVIFIFALFPTMAAIGMELLGIRSSGGFQFLVFSTNPCVHFELLNASGGYSYYGPDAVEYVPFFSILYFAACGGLVWALLGPFNALARRNA